MCRGRTVYSRYASLCGQIVCRIYLSQISHLSIVLRERSRNVPNRAAFFPRAAFTARPPIKQKESTFGRLRGWSRNKQHSDPWCCLWGVLDRKLPKWSKKSTKPLSNLKMKKGSGLASSVFRRNGNYLSASIRKGDHSNRPCGHGDLMLAERRQHDALQQRDESHVIADGNPTRFC